MSSLSVYHVSSPDLPNKVLTHFDDITATLAEQGVRFDRWQAAAKLQPGASDEELVAAYQGPLDQLMTERGYRGCRSSMSAANSNRPPNHKPGSSKNSILKKTTYGFLSPAAACSTCTSASMCTPCSVRKTT